MTSLLEEIIIESNEDKKLDIDMFFVHISECKECNKAYQKMCKHFTEVKS